MHVSSCLGVTYLPQPTPSCAPSALQTNWPVLAFDKKAYRASPNTNELSGQEYSNAPEQISLTIHFSSNQAETDCSLVHFTLLFLHTNLGGILIFMSCWCMPSQWELG